MKYRVVVALVILGFTASWALPQVPAGPEFQVNTYFTERQSRPAVSTDSTGNFVVVWDSVGQEDWFWPGIFAQRYDRSGAPRGAEFHVNTYTTNWQGSPSVAADAAGNFVVVWNSNAQDVSQMGVFGQRYDALGTPRGSEFQVNTYTRHWEGDPSVASAAGGNFIVAWESGPGQDGWGAGIFAQRYDASGAPSGPELRVNTFTTSNQRQASVAADPAGNFVIAWASHGQDGSDYGIFAQRFNASGMPRGSEFRVNSYTTNSQTGQSVALDAAGNFVVAWTSGPIASPPPPPFAATINLTPDQDGSGHGVYAQRYDASGVPRGSEFQLNTSTFGDQGAPSVASDAAGNFVVAWWETPAALVARRYDSSGDPRGSQFQLSTYGYGPALASDVVGNLIGTWSNGADVYGQRFGGIVPAALAVDTAASGGSDGNRVLEPGESVDVRPSWRNVNGAAQTFDGNVLSFSGPPANGVGYQLLDGAGAYGTVPNGTTAPCSNCYQAAVAFGGTRPLLHWDATLTERLTPDVLGQTKPWSIHVGESFADVSKTSPFYRFVETLLHKGVTAGCAAGTYCPSAPTTREQMAAFVLLAREGAGYAPLACSPPNLFADVPETSIFCDVIEELARRGVVSGCGGGNYCPTSAVTREQMAVFVLRTLDPALSPPPCAAPIFADVPASSPYCSWIEELARRGVVTGCGGGNYCPLAPVTREQMAVFVTVTFGLTLYGP